MDVLEKIWVEKYRPTKIEDFIGNKTLVDKFKFYIEQDDIPNLLLWGPAGTGKTSLAKILMNNLDCEYLFLNGSDENNVDTVRNKIKNFASGIGFKKFKVILYDEADYLSPQAQAILRSTIEEFYQHTRFVFTCNYVDRIIDPLKSRFQSFEIKSMEMDQIKAYVLNILQKENVTIARQLDIDNLIKSCYPDIRKTINTLQKCTSPEKVFELKEAEILDDVYKSKIINLLKTKAAFEEIRTVVINATIPDYSLLYKLLFDNVNDFIPEQKRANAMVFIAEYLYRSGFVVDKEINFSACILKLKELQ